MSCRRVVQNRTLKDSPKPATNVKNPIDFKKRIYVEVFLKQKPRVYEIQLVFVLIC